MPSSVGTAKVLAFPGSVPIDFSVVDADGNEAVVRFGGQPQLQRYLAGAPMRVEPHPTEPRVYLARERVEGRR